MVGKDGLTPYERRHETPAPYRQYAFGALVLLHPHRPVPRQGEPLHDKLQSRLVPCVLVEVTVGPGGIWARSYGVIPLSRFTSENRPSRASIRRSCDIVFPDIITFPLKQRLALHGALADKSLPEPLVSDEAESWELAEDRSAIEDEVDYFDGKWKENAAKFETSTPLEHILALEPDTQDAEDAPEEAAESTEFAAIDADRAEAQQDREAIQPEIAVIEGGKAPPGWRIDRFKCLDRVRLVAVPPWSRRPPTIEPEPWIGVGRAHQKELRAAWEKDDPVGFKAQEDRRAAWLRAKRRAVVAVPVAVAVPPEANQLNKPTGENGAECHELDVFQYNLAKCCPAVAGSARGTRDANVAASRAERQCLTQLIQQVRSKIISGEHTLLLLELGCSKESELSAAVPPHCIAVRITAKEDLRSKATKRALHGLIRLCQLYNTEVHVWVSVVCTYGSPWRQINEAKGVQTGDRELTDDLIEAAIPLCDHADRTNNTFSWEWSSRNLLWRDRRIIDLKARRGTVDCVVSTAAVGMSFVATVHGEKRDVFLTKKWRIATTHPGIPIELEPFQNVPGNIPKGELH